MFSSTSNSTWYLSRDDWESTINQSVFFACVLLGDAELSDVDLVFLSILKSVQGCCDADATPANTYLMILRHRQCSSVRVAKAYDFSYFKHSAEQINGKVVCWSRSRFDRMHFNMGVSFDEINFGVVHGVV